jgi:hypothetical protein
MAFAPNLAVLDAVAAQEMRNGTHCALRGTLIGWRAFHNGNILANLPEVRTVLRRLRNLPNSLCRGTYGG